MDTKKEMTQEEILEKALENFGMMFRAEDFKGWNEMTVDEIDREIIDSMDEFEQDFISQNFPNYGIERDWESGAEYGIAFDTELISKYAEVFEFWLFKEKMEMYILNYCEENELRTVYLDTQDYIDEFYKFKNRRR